MTTPAPEPTATVLIDDLGPTLVGLRPDSWRALAEETGLNHVTLHKLNQPGRIPDLRTLIPLLKALGGGVYIYLPDGTLAALVDNPDGDGGDDEG